MNDPREAFGMRLVAYLGGDLDADDRAAFENEVLADPEKARALAEAVNLDAAVRESLSMKSQGTAPRSRGRLAGWLVLPAAAALAAWLLWPGADSLDTAAQRPVMRGGTVSVRGMSPRGEVSVPVERFTWTRHPAAVQYRLELLDIKGQELYTALVDDTTLVRGQPGFPCILETEEPMSWRVVPLLADGREGRASAPVVFSSGSGMSG